MKEDFLHFIFKNRLWDKDSLVLESGQEFEIIDTGIYNYDSGPDFFNAKIKIDGTVWAGNVEIHVNASDWYKHKHNHDFSYDNVILHVVFDNDKSVLRSMGDEIPVWEIKFPHFLYNKYSSFKNSDKQIACEDFIDIPGDIVVRSWIERMGVERLESRYQLIENYLEKTKSDWEQAFYILLARSFGFHTNSLPFEMLALSIPLSIVRKNSDDLFKMEALFFGQSGLLESAFKDSYVLKLKKEYSFLAAKYSLSPLKYEIWKTGKLRPGNTPVIRIAQFAALMQTFQGLFSSIIENKLVKDIENYFKISVSDYWQNHYCFGKETPKSTSKFGKSAFETIMINTIAPFRLIYDTHYRNTDSDISLQWLEEIRPENNRIIRIWEQTGIKANNAFETQALIQLKNNYCDHKKCIYCNIGVSIFRELQKID